MSLLFSSGDGQTSGAEGLDLIHCKPYMPLLFSMGGGLNSMRSGAGSPLVTIFISSPGAGLS